MAVVAAAWQLVRPQRLEVHGESMTPTLLAGDRLLAVRARHPRSGWLVAVADPREPQRLLVKKVAAVEVGGIRLVGENVAASTDSRHFGLVEPATLSGRVVYRYWPPERSGWLVGAGDRPARRR